MCPTGRGENAGRCVALDEMHESGINKDAAEAMTSVAKLPTIIPLLFLKSYLQVLRLVAFLSGSSGKRPPIAGVMFPNHHYDLSAALCRPAIYRSPGVGICFHHRAPMCPGPLHISALVTDVWASTST